MRVERLRMALEMPRLLTPVSAWIEHIPFAMALVDWLAPSTIVELGTHMGDSYCAFCQAVEVLGLKTRCTAIDTWRGDAQAGFYGEEVLRDLRAHHDPRYGGFSRLLQTTFEEAASLFPPESIDLLHIDGLHNYEAVKKDFEMWLPKMSNKGVVLFHDTQERKGEFGVWRVWKEATQGRRSFEFTHGHGLGVLLAGPAVEGTALDEFLTWADLDMEMARGMFAVLGHRLNCIQKMKRMAQLADAQKDLAGRAIYAASCMHTAGANGTAVDPQQPAGEHHVAWTLYCSDSRGVFSDERSCTEIVPLKDEGAARRLVFHTRWKRGMRLRLDPGDESALWFIEELEVRPMGEGGGHEAFGVRLVALSDVDVRLQEEPPAGDGEAARDKRLAGRVVLFCRGNDPQVELVIEAAPEQPAECDLAVTVVCRAG